jgi:Protein of unknown function (DUF3574)
LLARAAIVGVLALAASFAAADAQQLQCSGTQKPWMVADLLFGRDHVSEAKWARFLADEVTPRFPSGFTVFDAKGQWRDSSSGTIAKERSKIIVIAMPPAADNDTRLNEIIEHYKTRFKQQSVGLIVRPACVSF